VLIMVNLVIAAVLGGLGYRVWKATSDRSEDPSRQPVA